MAPEEVGGGELVRQTDRGKAVGKSGNIVDATTSEPLTKDEMKRAYYRDILLYTSLDDLSHSPEKQNCGSTTLAWIKHPHDAPYEARLPPELTPQHVLNACFT